MTDLAWRTRRSRLVGAVAAWSGALGDGSGDGCETAGDRHEGG